MNHQTFNKKSYGFLLYFTFQGLHSLFFQLSSLLYRVIVNSAAKVQSGCDKNWHRRRKDEEGRLNCRWNTISILPGKECDHDSDKFIIFTYETTISEKQAALKQIKKLKLANKQADIQAFFVIFAFETAISKTAVSKNNTKKR